MTQAVSGALDEFQLIADLFAPISRTFPGALGLTDDAAFLTGDSAVETVVTVDAMVAGVHFFPDDPADLIARKLIRVNLSDLAAKGAVPFAILLAAAFPAQTDAPWLRRFADGLAEDAACFGVALIGGDTVKTPGPLTLSLTALGRVEKGRGLLRSGAKDGDLLWVSGAIGDGALGLAAARGELILPQADRDFLVDRYRLPQPRVQVGPKLVGLASAAMDISDGLVQDLGHLCRASGLSARVDAHRVPLSPSVRAVVEGGQSPLATALTGGDDYELLFAAPAEANPAILALAHETGVALTPIGQLAAGQGVTVLDHSGQAMALATGGWRHFGGMGESGI